MPKSLALDNVGLILIGHGSKLPHNQENLEKLADILRERSSFRQVEIAFMIRNPPTISEAIDNLTRKKVDKIVLVPVFLASGVHTTKEIPEMIEVKDKESQLSQKGIQLFYGEPIGADECIAVILEEKALKALGHDWNHHHAPFKAAPVTTYPATSSKIYDQSMKLIRPEIQGVLSKAPKNQIPIIERVVHTTADPEFAKLLVISDGAVEAGVAAIKAGAKVFTDTKMIKAGIHEGRVQRFGGRILTFIDDQRASKLAIEEEITRSSAAVRLAVADGAEGAIFLIGNAPTAAFELADQIEKGKVKPALVVAVPVGYVGAAESKEAITKLQVPYIITKGRKGSSTIAVAIFNALLNMAEAKP
ncbi:MAG: sirohydrochlorin nickelochelatase [Candidatus Bathyarchaeota archaeon]|nr:sirohydrochlorin nickelochelatase [Candidatus Bathyarchaeota archaeon]